MSLIVAIKDQDRIVFGADKQTSAGNSTAHSATKIWRVKDFPNAIMGGCGLSRASQIIQYSCLVDKNYLGEEIDTEYVITSIVPQIMGALEHNGVSCAPQKDEDVVSTYMPNIFLFAWQDKAWVIWHDFSVTELKDYLAIGSGAEVATGALFATKGKNPFERIVTAIDAAAETTLYVDHEIDLLVTDERESDEDLATNALYPEIIDKVVYLDQAEELPAEKETKPKKQKTKKEKTK